MKRLSKQLCLVAVVLAVSALPVWAQGGHLAAIVDTTSNRPDLFYIDTSNHVHVVQLIAGSWRNLDLTKQFGSPNALAGSSLTGIMDTIDKKATAYYIAADQDIHQLAFVAPNWKDTDVTAAAGAAQPAGRALSTVVDPGTGLIAVFYIGNDQHVHYLGFDPTMQNCQPPCSPWYDIDVTATAFPDQTGIPSKIVNAAVTSPLASNSFDGRVWAYFIGVDGNLHALLDQGPAGWFQRDDLGPGLVTPVPQSSLASLDKDANFGVLYYLPAPPGCPNPRTCPENHPQDIVQEGTGENIAQLLGYYVTFGASNPAPAPASPMSGLFDIALFQSGYISIVFYHTGDGHVHASSTNVKAFPLDADLTPNGPGAIVGSSLASMVAATTNDVFYISPDRHVQLLSLTQGQLPNTSPPLPPRDITPNGPPAIP